MQLAKTRRAIFAICKAEFFNENLKDRLRKNRGGIFEEDWCVVPRLREYVDLRKKLRLTAQGRAYVRQLDRCGYGTKCGLPFCLNCKLDKMLYERAKTVSAFKSAPDGNVGWMTVLIALRFGTIAGLRSDIGSFRTQMRNFIDRWKIKDSAMAETKVHGFFEVDHFRPSDLHSVGPYKTKALKALATEDDWSDSEMDPFSGALLLHFHAVIQVPDLQVFARRLRAQFPGPYRVKIKPLFQSRPIEKNLQRLTAYMLKMNPRYVGMDETRGTKGYFSFFGFPRRTFLNSSDALEFADFLRSLQFRGLKFSYGLSQSENMDVASRPMSRIRNSHDSWKVSAMRKVHRNSLPRSSKSLPGSIMNRSSTSVSLRVSYLLRLLREKRKNNAV